MFARLRLIRHRGNENVSKCLVGFIEREFPLRCRVVRDGFSGFCRCSAGGCCHAVGLAPSTSVASKFSQTVQLPSTAPVSDRIQPTIHEHIGNLARSLSRLNSFQILGVLLGRENSTHLTFGCEPIRNVIGIENQCPCTNLRRGDLRTLEMFIRDLK
jgi:hypothetical protein